MKFILAGSEANTKSYDFDMTELIMELDWQDSHSPAP